MTYSKFLLKLAAAAASLMLLSAATQAQQKTARACDAEWKANKAAIQGSGKTKKAFMVECRAGTEQTAVAPKEQPAPVQAAPNQSATDQPAPSQPAPNQAATNQAPAGNSATQPAPRQRKAARQPLPSSRRGTAVSAAAGEFATETEAKAHCPGETVVWANTRSKIYHFAGTRSYGKTKNGAFMCEKDTSAAGMRSAKNEKRRQ